MLNLIDETLGDFSGGSIDLAPRRFGRVVACDGGLIEVSGLGVPIGSLCSIVHGGGQSHLAEAIGFRNGHTIMMMLGDTVLLRPGARLKASERLALRWVSATAISQRPCPNGHNGVGWGGAHQHRSR